jgi:hypothetical protein
MENIKKSIGDRLKEIRYIFLEGEKVSRKQFAYAIGENKDNVANYEIGRANIPNRVLTTLYERGFNPTYILTGEGSLFADNESGRTLRDIISSKKIKNSTVSNVREYDFSKLSLKDLERKVAQYQVAAGDIMKIIEKKKALESQQ